MAKMRQYTYLEMTKIVKRNGYEYARCTGDHCIYKREDGSGTIVLAKKEAYQSMYCKAANQREQFNR